MSRPILYIKPGCPWCTEALDYFKRKGVALDLRDVIADPAEMRALVAASGQTKCPTFRHGSEIKADFGVDEFVAWAKAKPSLCAEIGLKL